ncbi:MAG: 6-phosphogluconolactonase [Phycisphaerales bacterium]|nr:6-phosphogluconolactonase [Phycisphaerales bacterium]
MNNPNVQSYDLDPVATPPALPGSVRVGADREETLDRLAAELFIQANNCVRSFGEFHFALSYGDIQERLLIKMMVDPKYRSMPWSKTHLWSVIETNLPPEHPEHSMTHWSQIAADAGGIPEEQIHRVQGHDPSGPTLYEQEIIEHLEWRERGQDRLDFVLIGDDLQLIEGVDDPLGGLVGFTQSDTQIAMTRRLIDASRFVAILAVGQSGRGLVEALTQNKHNIGVSPTGGVLRWYLDGYACNHTQEESA